MIGQGGQVYDLKNVTGPAVSMLYSIKQYLRTGDQKYARYIAAYKGQYVYGIVVNGPDAGKRKKIRLEGDLDIISVQGQRYGFNRDDMRYEKV